MKNKHLASVAFGVLALGLAAAVLWLPRAAQPSAVCAESEAEVAHQHALPGGTGPSPAVAAAPQAAAPQPAQPARSLTLAAIPADTELRRELEQLAPAARAIALAKLGRRPIPAEDFASLHADPAGGIYYACTFVPPHGPAGDRPLATTTPIAAAAEAATAAAAPAGSVPISSPPIRHSRPGSTKTLFIDFNGAVVSGTVWNTTYGTNSYDCAPFDTDNDPTTFSPAEQAAILEIWQRVAEDYSPFDIDVTTEHPAFLGYSSAQALVTPSKDRNNVALPRSATAAGVAYVDEFGYATYANYLPAFIYSDKMSNSAANIAEGVSHEIGHNMGLSHDGTSGGGAYYYGHGSGETSWAPIMGASYNRNVTQWSKGEYYNANNTEDDLAILDAKLDRRNDDTGATTATARALTTTGHSLAGSGIIETRGDSDTFSFATLAGQISVTASPYRSTSGTYGGDTDLKLELLGSGGNVIATAAPTATTTATITATVAAGTYYARVSAEGVGSPQNASPTGYTAYGSLGQYFITGSRVVLAPTVTGPTLLDAHVGDSLDFRIAASDVAETFQAYNLPSWLALDSTTGRITGVPTATGTFYITLAASNNAGSAQCQLRLNVAAGPPVLSGLARRTVVAPGATATLAVTATSAAPPVSYRWYHSGVEVPSATQSSLVLSAITREQAGWYQVVATDSNGSRTSHPAFVLVAPTATDIQPFGQFPDDATDAIHGMRDIIQIACSYGRAVGLRRDGTVYGWGATYENGQAPIPAGLSDVVAVAGGGVHTMALRADGTVAVWSLVDPQTHTIPAPPPGLTNVVAIAARDGNCLALKADGTVALWGLTAATFQPPADLANVAAIALGRDHGLALRRDGTIAAWGANAFGQANVPANAVPARAIAAGEGVSFAIRTDGTLVPWGTGHDLRVDLVPSDLGPVRQIAVARTHATALLPGANARAWATPNLEWSLANTPRSECVWSVAAGGTYTYLLRDRGLFAAPVVITSPTDVVCAPGGQAVFTAVITGAPTPYLAWELLDPAHLDWGWQPIDVDSHCSDDGSGTLTVTDVPESLNGFRFRCWADNGMGTGVLSGEALLTIVVGGWPAFLAQHFSAAERTDPAIAGPASDPDNDGLANLVEYAFARNPRSAEPSAPVSFTRDSGRPKFAFTQPHSAADLTYSLQRSSDLQTWTDVPAAEYTRTATALTAAVDQVELQFIAPTADSRQFYRLRVRLP